jgi:hypothetical protein
VSDETLRETMSAVRKLGAVAVVVVALVLAACTSPEALVPTTTRVPVPSKPLPAVDLSATPVGWIPVAYGDAQVSVPPDFPIAYPGQGFPCKGALASGRGGLLVDAPPGFTLHCLVERHPTMVFLVSIRKRLSVAFVRKSTMLNGVRVYRLLTAVTYAGYYAASLGVEVIAQGPLAKRILATLTRSPRTMALASGSTPAVPPDWKTLTYHGLSFAAPARWPVTRTSYNYGVGDPCNTPGVDFFNEGVGGGEVVLSTDRFLAGFSCSARRNPGPVYPGDGVEVDAGSKTLSELAAEGLHLAFSKHCLDLHGLAACPATLPAYSILVLKVTVPGHKQPVYVSIGLAGNGMVARTILYSLRAA